MILDQNIHHFSQAGDTPLASNEIIDMLGFGRDTEMAQQILDGTADIPQITDNKAAQLLLESMKCDTDPIILNFTSDNMMNRYKKWKEKRSCQFTPANIWDIFMHSTVPSSSPVAKITTKYATNKV